MNTNSKMDESAANTSNGNGNECKRDAMLVQITTDGIPKLHCPVCNKALVSLAGYVKHVKKHDPPGGFCCRYCESRYCSEEELKRHLDEVHTTICCRICKNSTFTNEDDYRDHIRVTHNGVDREMFTCKECGAEYKTIEPYKRHMDTQCGSVKPFKCDIDQCSMSFVTKYNLKQHKATHNGERKFCCSYCGKNFLQKGRLMEHERIHTGEKPYKCDVCGKCFAHRESIVTHSSLHTGVRLVECKCCLSRFSCYSNLIKHRRTRPETCGLPEYDPPKNRRRTYRSRIPATLNPTSEIKVSNFNKVIKPDDLEKDKKLKAPSKTSSSLVEQSATKKSTRKRGKRRKQEELVNLDSVDDLIIYDNNDSNAGSVSSDDEPLAKIRQTRQSSNSNAHPSSLKKGDKGITWSWTDSDIDYPDFDPADSDDSEADKDFVSPVKQEHDEESANDFIDCIETDPDYVEPCCDLKEEDGNIFSEKDKLLDVLLKDDDDDDDVDDNTQIMNGRDFSQTTNTKPFQTVKMEDNRVGNDAIILEETESVPIKVHDTAATVEEDVLAVQEISFNDLSDCKVLIEDITLRYPKLKGQPSIKVARNAKSLPAVHKSKNNHFDKPKRKYRKRGERDANKSPPTTDGPKRVAKISQQELKERLKMLKKEEKSWKCDFCIKIYHMRKPYEKHLRHDHSLSEDKIKDIFQVESVANELDGDVFKCEICDKIYLMEKRLIAHIKLHGTDGKLIFKCPCYCNLFFASKDAATEHAHKEHRDLLYCEMCDKFMTGHDSLKNHMKNHHHSKKEPRNLPRNLVCDKCGKKFAGRTSLTDHVRSDCGRVPLYPCTVCGKHLTTAGILKTHLLLHKDDTPYQCDKCGKTFKVKAQYKSHIKTRHSDIKPFKCHLCPKEYPYRESLLTHMTVHTGIKRFLCNGCGKRFTCISNLQAHRRVQTESCGQLPLNARATQYMGVQKGNLLLGAKPEAGLEYQETNTLLAKDVLDRDVPMAQALNFPSEPSAPLATVPLNYTGHQPANHLLLPPVTLSHIIDVTHPSSTYN